MATTVIAATAMAIARCGDVHRRTALPVAVEHAGGINKEDMQFFRMCRDAADMYSKLNTRVSNLPVWPSKPLSNFFLRPPPLANPAATSLW